MWGVYEVSVCVCMGVWSMCMCEVFVCEGRRGGVCVWSMYGECGIYVCGGSVCGSMYGERGIYVGGSCVCMVCVWHMQCMCVVCMWCVYSVYDDICVCMSACLHVFV